VRAAEEEGEGEEGDGGVVVGEAVAEKVEGSEDSREGRPAKETGKPVSGEGRGIEASGGGEGHPAAGPAEGASAPGQTLPSDPREFWEGRRQEEEAGSEGGASEGDAEGDASGETGDGAGGGAEGDAEAVGVARKADAGADTRADTRADAGGLLPDSDPSAAVHLKTLGRIPFWRGRKVPPVILAGMTAAAAPLGLEIVAGAEGGVGGEDGE
jgi:hypothetical protein